MPKDLSLLMTEQQNINTLHIDEMDTIDILNTINHEDQNVALAVENELAYLLKDFPGYLALSVTDENSKSSTTIMSFIQAQKTENIFYMVADKKASKISDIKRNSQVSFTTWFDKLEKGGRLTSNRVHAEILEEAKAQEIVKKEGLILSLHENAENMSIIALRIESALYENFKGQTKVINFEK